MSLAIDAPRLFRPPAPVPRTGPMPWLRLVRAMATNPIEIWGKIHFEEPVVIGPTPVGLRAVVSDPGAIKRIFLDNASNYAKDGLQLRLLSPALGVGLFTTEGEDWRRQRRALAPLFTPRDVAKFVKPMREVAASFARDDIVPRLGKAFDASEVMARLTLLVLERTLFSQGLGRDPGDFQRAVTQYFNTFGRLSVLDLLGAPKFLPRIGRWRGRSSLQFFSGAVDDIIAARRRLIAYGAPAPYDLLSLLLRAADDNTADPITDAEVRSNVFTFIGAGHETTANALTWTLILLSKSPEWRARVEAEIDAHFDPAGEEDPTLKLPVTLACFNEALRLYPPAAFMSREALADDELCGRKIAKGTVVIVAPYIVHRHRRLWSDAEFFDPSRFLSPRKETIDRFQFLPFGAGPRICIGMGFAQQEAMIVLATLLSQLRFELVPGAETFPAQRITLRPRDGAPMTAKPRIPGQNGVS
jgi:cytochrome P450